MALKIARFAALTGALLLCTAGAQAADQQKSFASPDEAAKQLAEAVKSGEVKAMVAVLGAGGKAIVSSGDKVADRAGYQRFAKAYQEANKIEMSGDAKAVLAVGKDAWPFPIPLVKDSAGWRFDTAAGKEEILNRRIGRNELSTMQAAQAYVDAQREYYLANPQKDKLLQYAQKFVSSQGKRDGLYYPAKAGEAASPLGPAFERAKAEGYAQGGGGYHGYKYKILKAQGPDAKGGAYDYVAQGRMIGGYALIAWPAAYGNSGVMTFLINQDGVIYEKDLGPQTAALAGKVTKFNPDKGWKQADKK